VLLLEAAVNKTFWNTCAVIKPDPAFTFFTIRAGYGNFTLLLIIFQEKPASLAGGAGYLDTITESRLSISVAG